MKVMHGIKLNLFPQEVFSRFIYFLTDNGWAILNSIKEKRLGNKNKIQNYSQGTGNDVNDRRITIVPIT